MTIEQRTERFFNPGGSTPVGAPVTAVPFADLPNPADAPGQIRTISDVGPAPGIELVSDGSRWRPRGGRQVLAMRTTNPVTVQDLAGAVAETIGPFPGGLVRAGMQLAMEMQINHSGPSSSAKIWQAFINGITFMRGQSANSTNNLFAVERSTLNMLSDGAFSVFRRNSNAPSYGVDVVHFPEIFDLSVDWSVDIRLQSAAETAVNITNATWAAGVATFTAASHTLAVGDKTTIAGVDPAGYNGTYIVDTVPDSDTFTAALAADPGAYVSGGTSSRVSNMISQSYVLELIG